MIVFIQYQVAKKEANLSIKKKDNTFISKKRKEEKEENDNKNQQNSSNGKILEDVVKINDEESKPNINENAYEKTYTIDDSLKNVITVKQQNQKLMAVVDKMDSKGEIVKTYIPTEESRKSNPWI